LQAFYEERYFRGGREYGYSDYLAGEKNHRRNAQCILGLLAEQTNRRGRLLDVGCAHGFFVDEANKAGWESEGVECSEEGHQYASHKLGVKVFKGDLAGAGFPAEHFDVVSIIGTIEHLTNPLEFLEEASRVLKRGGRLIITTVDTEGPLPLFRFKPPEHLYYFSGRNLSKALGLKGFRVERKAFYWVQYSLEEFLGLALVLLFGPRFPTQSLLKWLPGLERSLKLPTNEMLIVATNKGFPQ
jgi:SAM-dependent methyltransferase